MTPRVLSMVVENYPTQQSIAFKYLLSFMLHIACWVNRSELKYGQMTKHRRLSWHLRDLRLDPEQSSWKTGQRISDNPFSTAMRRISPLERSLDQLLAPNSSRSVCRSCRLRVISQRRNLHTTQPQQAFTDRLFGRKEKVPEAQQGGSVTEADRYEAEAGQRASGSAGGRRGRVAERIDPTKEPEYIVATSWEGLERIGGEKWIEESLDQGDTYVG